MREPSKDPKRLTNILESIDTIFQCVGNDDMDAFVANRMCYHAVVYNIMVIGEVSNTLTKKFRENLSEILWRQITGMKDFLIHGYHQVRKDIIWKVIEEDLHLLRPQIVGYLTDFSISMQ